MPPRKSAARGDKPKPSTKEEVKAEQPAPSSTQAPAEEVGITPRMWCLMHVQLVLAAIEGDRMAQHASTALHAPLHDSWCVVCHLKVTVHACSKRHLASRLSPESHVACLQQEAPDVAPEEEWSYMYYTFRQHIGFVLGALSIFLTWYTWEENNPNSVWRAVACLCLCLVGVAFHEMRPFKVSRFSAQKFCG